MSAKISPGKTFLTLKVYPGTKYVARKGRKE